MPPDGAVKQLSVPDAMELVVRLVANRRLDEAVALLQRILQVAPDNPDALNYLAMATLSRGDEKEALRLLRRAAELAPDFAGVQNNLGNILFESGDFADAEKAYERSLEIEPNQPQAATNLAAALARRGENERAEALFRRALQISPEHGVAHYNFSKLLAGQRRFEEASRHYWSALTLLPPADSNPQYLALAFAKAGRRDEAVAIIRQWVERDPDSREARHLLASHSGEGVPLRADDLYVEAMFDGFSTSFDEKLEKLEYRAPELCVGALGAIAGAPRGDLTVLDAGCGTGLCGPLLRPFAERLEGVDLSGGMLERAEATGLYDALAKAELTAFLRRAPAVYHAIVAADTLCYFGELDGFAAAAAAALRPRGLLAFSVEALSDDAGEEHRLRPSGRYAHSRRYLDCVLGAVEIDILSCRLETLRLEAFEPVTGYIVVARLR